MSTGEEVLRVAEDKLKKSISSFQEELKTIRTGRANPEIFRRVKVDCYGSSLPLHDVCTISVPDGSSFIIKPFDQSNIKAIEQAIASADLGLNPSNDGSTIRVILPALSRDRRNELAKQVSKLAEEGRISLRRVRQKSKDDLKKIKEEISEDDLKKLQEQLEKIVVKYSKEIEELGQKKEQELFTV